MNEALKPIIEELKKEGIDLAEDLAAGAAKAIFRALPQVALATENKVDDVVVPVLTAFQPKVLELIDKIDGEEG